MVDATRWLEPSWCCSADQEAARALVGGRPDEIAHALETEDRVVNVERQHRLSVRGIGRRRGDPGRHGAGLGDAFLEQLAIAGLAVIQHRAGILGLVQLPHGRIDADLTEQVGHAEGARLVGHDRHHARPQGLVLEQVAEQAHGRHRGGHLLAVGLGGELPVAG
jgi:hypothetical protein